MWSGANDGADRPWPAGLRRAAEINKEEHPFLREYTPSNCCGMHDPDSEPKRRRRCTSRARPTKVPRKRFYTPIQKVAPS